MSRASIVTVFGLALCLTQLSCGRLQNNADHLRLTCGADIDAQENIYIHIPESTADSFDAVLVENDHLTPLRTTRSGCIEVPRQHGPEASIAIRDRTQARGRLIPYPGAPTLLLTTELIAETELSDRLVKWLCPSERFTTQRRLALSRVEQPSQLLTRSQFRVEIHDNKDQLVLSKALVEPVLNLDDSFAEGDYQLKIISQDIFERNPKPFTSTCQLTLDRTAPSVSSSLASEPYYEPLSGVHRLAPGARVTLEGAPGDSDQIWLCLKNRLDIQQVASCSDEDFLPARSLTVPTEGVWDLFYYATDKAGNRSTVQRESLTAYHQQEIDQLLTQLANVKLNLLLGQQEASLSSMKEARKIRQQLKLAGEQEAIRWPYIENFWKLDQNINFVNHITLESPIAGVPLVNPYSDQFVVRLRDKQTLLFEKRRLVRRLDPASSVEFAGPDRLWSLGYDKQLRLIQNKGQDALRSFPMDFKDAKASVSLAVGKLGSKAVVWSDGGTRIAMRVFSEQQAGSSPLFATELISVRYVKGKFAFFDKDRYLVARNNDQILIWDTQENFQLKTYPMPPGCLAQDFTIRDDSLVYAVSHRAPGSNQNGDESFCELTQIDPQGPSKDSTINKRMTDVSHPNSITLSAEPGQNFLALSGLATPWLYTLNLSNDGENGKFELQQGEEISSIEPMSREQPVLFVKSLQRVRLLRFSARSQPTVYFSEDTLGNCVPHIGTESLLCYDLNQSELRIHSSRLDKTLQPWLYRAFTPNQADDSTPYQIAANVASPQQAFIDGETSTVSLQDDTKKIRAQVKLQSPSSAAHMRDDGLLSLGFIDGSIGVLSDKQGFLKLQGPGEGEPILDIMSSSQGLILALRASALDFFQYDGQSLRYRNSLSLSPESGFTKILYSEKSQRGVLYQAAPDRSVSIVQEVLIFDKAGEAQGPRLPISMCDLQESLDGRGFYYLRDAALFFHDFGRGSDAPVPGHVSGDTCLILEGPNDLYGVAGSQLLHIKTGEVMAEGMVFAMGPEGTVIVTTTDDNNLKVIRGRKVLFTLPFKQITEVQRILSRPDHSDILLITREWGLGQGVRRLTTDVNRIDELLGSWDF